MLAMEAYREVVRLHNLDIALRVKRDEVEVLMECFCGDDLKVT